MVQAKLRYLRMSPRKVRLVADVIRELDVKRAQNQLEFMNKRAAGPVLKLLNSAIANAKNNFKLSENNLFIKELRVDEGPTLKRWMPRAMGRATPINKRSSHITIVLDEKREAGSGKLEAGGKKRETKKEIKKYRNKEIGKQEEVKVDKDVRIVKSLDEVKELGKQSRKASPRDREDAKVGDEKKLETKEHKVEPFDVRREGKDRGKQHLDAVKRKSKGGVLKRMFRRKSV